MHSPMSMGSNSCSPPPPNAGMSTTPVRCSSMAMRKHVHTASHSSSVITDILSSRGISRPRNIASPPIL